LICYLIFDDDILDGRSFMSEIAKPIPDTRVGPKRVAPVGGAIKRLIDIILAAAAIGLMLPLLVLCGVATFLASGRPIVARHRRIGFRGRAFECFSFETSAETRVTRLGAALRKAGLDELPQLFNVLRGDMSIVGPQPISSNEFDQYADQAAAYLSCKPGITGLWRVHGKASRLERVSLDCDYARSWSPLLDAKIAISTLSAALGPTAHR
jgi:exopolysaccharide production protein ExoY